MFKTVHQLQLKMMQVRRDLFLPVILVGELKLMVINVQRIVLSAQWL